MFEKIIRRPQTCRCLKRNLLAGLIAEYVRFLTQRWRTAISKRPRNEAMHDRAAPPAPETCGTPRPPTKSLCRFR